MTSTQVKPQLVPRQYLLGCFVWLHFLTVAVIISDQIFGFGLLPGTSWRASLLFAYTAGCMFYGIAFALIFANVLSPFRRTLDVRLLRLGALLRARVTVRDRFVGSLTRLLYWAKMTLYWPVMWVCGLVASGGSAAFAYIEPEQAFASIQRRTAQAELTLTVAATGLTILGWSSMGGVAAENLHAQIFLGLMGVALIARHLSYLVSRLHPIADMRRYIKLPYVSFLALVALDLVSVTVVVAACYKDATRLSPFEIYRDVALDIFNGRRFLFELLFQRTVPSLYGVGTICLGIMLYFSAFRLLPFKKERFKPSGTDYGSRALLAIMEAKPETALQYLAGVSKDTFEGIRIWATVLLANGNLTASFELFRRLLVIKERPVATEWIFIWATAVSSSSLISKDVRHKLFEWAIHERVADWCVWLFVCMATGTNDDSLRQACMATLCREEGGERHYPLTLSELLISEERGSEAMEVLAVAKPGLEVEETVRIILLLCLRLTGEEAEPTKPLERLQAWFRSEEREVIDELLRLSWDNPFYCMAGLIAFSRLRSRATSLSAGDEAARINELIYKLRERSPGAHEAKEMMGSIEAAIEHGAVF